MRKVSSHTAGFANSHCTRTNSARSGSPFSSSQSANTSRGRSSSGAAAMAATKAAAPIRAVPAAFAEAAIENDDHRKCLEVEIFVAIFCLLLWFVLRAHSAHIICHRPSASHRRWHDLSRNFFFFQDSTRDFIRNPTHHPSYLFFYFWTSIWLRLDQKPRTRQDIKLFTFHLRFTRECEDMARILRAQIIQFEFKTQSSGLK